MEKPAPLMAVVLMGVLFEEGGGCGGGSGLRSSCPTSLDQLLNLCIAKTKQKKIKEAFECDYGNVNERKTSAMGELNTTYKTE